MVQFRRKLAVVTGGASGVGRSLALALGTKGASVLIADVDESGLENTHSDLQAKGGAAYSMRCDVTNQANVNELAAKTFDELGGTHFVFAKAADAPNIKPNKPCSAQFGLRSILC